MTEAQTPQVALVTGGVSGLGWAVSLSLARQGLKVYSTGRRHFDEAKASFAAEAGTRGAVEVVAVDVRDAEATTALFARIEQDEARLDVLVNAAGPYVTAKRALADYSRQEVESLLVANALASADYCRLAVPLMARRRFGRIVNFGFDGAGRLTPWPYRTAYAAAKAAVIELTLSLAQEVATAGITVNAICPGRIDEPWKERSIAEARQAPDEAGAPIGRPGTGEDVARLVSFLIEADSDYLTGCVIDLNGGEDVRRGRRAD